MEQQRYYHRHHPKKPREAVEVKGDKAVLALPVEELGLSMAGAKKGVDRQ